jgi:hypothetical protein
MNVRISSYRVVIPSRTVEIDIEVTLPTAPVKTTVVAQEDTLYAAATARGIDVWAEPDLVAVVSGLFRALADTVTAS